MDIKQLKIECQTFANRCKEKDYPLEHFCLVETYEGVTDTPYDMHIRADWIEAETACSPVLDILTEIMFEVMSPQARYMILTINVFDSNNELHCQGEVIIEDSQLVSV